MTKFAILLCLVLLAACGSPPPAPAPVAAPAPAASAPDPSVLAPNPNLVVQGIPPSPRSVVADVEKYTDFRGHSFVDWHPLRREMIVAHRKAGGSTPQLFRLSAPMAEPEPLTDSADLGLLLARVLPPFLVSPFAGVLVDRFDRKRLLIISDVLRTLVGLSLLFATSADRLWIIYVATIFQFIFSAIFSRNRTLPAIGAYC